MATWLPLVEVVGAPYVSSIEHLRDELARIEVLVRGQVHRAREVAGDDAHRGLAISEGEVDALMARALGAPPWSSASTPPSLDEAHALADRMALAIEQRRAMSTAPLRLAQLAARFGLDRFDLDVLLVSLAPELDLRYERLYAYLHDDVTRKRPSVDLALHLLCRSLDERFAARARFSAAAPLVRHDILQVLADPQASLPPLLAFTLKLDERVVDWLHGSTELEPRLRRCARRVAPRAALDALFVDGALRERLARFADSCSAGATSILYLQGPHGIGKRTAAEAIAGALGRGLLTLECAVLAGASDEEVERAVRRAVREARLDDHLLFCDRADLLLAGEQATVRAVLIDTLGASPAPVVLSGEAAWEPSDALRDRPFVRVQLDLPNAAAQERLWRAALAGAALAEEVDLAELAGRFRLSGGQIHDAAATARSLAAFRRGDGARVTVIDLIEACRRHSSRRLGDFARKVSARVAWEDLILPDDRVARLREISDQARHRALVLERWGFGRCLPNGKGLSALFVGAPGTGKTLAASVIATDLGLELYQIDLSAVVSKWVGETEKHLARIFDEAERGHALLFFDEADALFGKRSEVHDAQDRYANIETSYLLQRMEEYEGVVILASNFRRNMDDAFVRRLRFIVEFPLPDINERQRIWERILPAELPRAADLDLALMARRFDLAGAYIRNIALAAAFLAAANGQPLGQCHLLHAARREYQKLGKMTDNALFAATKGSS